jgi:cytosine/adenosine deaminase-related metal-dependent hydrolase
VLAEKKSPRLKAFPFSFDEIHCIHTQDQAFDRMLKTGLQFGFTPAAQVKIGIGGARILKKKNAKVSLW